MNSIESKFRTYWAYKNPSYYYVQFITLPIFFILWILCFLLGVNILSERITIGMFFWTFAWFLAGLIIFTLSLWYKSGIQIFKIDETGIRVIKKFMFIRISKSIPKNNINSVSIKKLQSFNLYTGREIKTDANLGWLVVNNDQNYFLNSYLFPIAELEKFQKKLIDENFKIN